MQLPAEQTSLEPHPRRASKGGPQAVREPEHPQEATAADSRASPPLLNASGSQIHRLGKNLNKLPNTRASPPLLNASGSQIHRLGKNLNKLPNLAHWLSRHRSNQLGA